MDILTWIKVVLTGLSLLVVLTYYFLLLKRRSREPIERRFKSITVIIPAHNEEDYIQEAVRSVMSAEFTGRKQIIVVDDGSTDRTPELLRRIKGVKVLRTKHLGKSAALNRALALAEGELVAVVDGDSAIPVGSLMTMADEVGKKGYAASCCPVKVRNRHTLLGMWLNLSEVYFSLIRELLSKAHANVTTPGPLSVYRRSALEEIGGFGTDVLSEDVDVAIRLIRKGYRIGFSDRTYAETNMPHRFKWFFLQRLRFARGVVRILKKHLKASRSAIDVYTLPVITFNYIQAVIMGALTLHQIIGGYFEYFYAYGIYFSWSVVRFFFEWFSVIGFFRWTFNVLSGSEPITTLSMIAIVSTMLSYPLMLLAILKYDRENWAWHVIPFTFMFPFWLFMMVLQMIALPEVFRGAQVNRWKKND
jgi:peptidoglycan-N-acetylglucosamine deacetylase